MLETLLSYINLSCQPLAIYHMIAILAVDIIQSHPLPREPLSKDGSLDVILGVQLLQPAKMSMINYDRQYDQT